MATSEVHVGRFCVVCKAAYWYIVSSVQYTFENECQSRSNIRVPDFNDDFRFYSIIYYTLVFPCSSKHVKSGEPLWFLCHLYNRFYFQSCRCVYYWIFRY